MLMLLHEGPAYRSKLMDREAALARADQLRPDPRFSAVRVMESTRTDRADRFFVVCHPADPEEAARLLRQFQAERDARAELEGPEYLWVEDPDAGVYRLLTRSGEPYVVDLAGTVCSCRDGGVCRDTGLQCKHLVALGRGLGFFVPADRWRRLQLLHGKLQQSPAPRLPVRLPVAA